jgi:hypothetical protein
MNRAIVGQCIALCSALQLAAASWGCAGERRRPPDAPPETQIYHLERITTEQLDKLDDDEMILVDGERTTKRALRTRGEAAAAAMRGDLERHRIEFSEAQRAERDARNARAWAELNRLQVRAQDPAYAEHRRKVLDDINELAERAEKAPSRERQRLEREAAELLRRFNALTQ